MTIYRDPKTKQRTAVLRPANPPLALQRLAEWNRLMDKAGDAISPEQGRVHKQEADQLWIDAKREQSWTFMGWLGTDTNTIVTGMAGDEPVAAAPGDMHEAEDRMNGWGVG